MGLYPHKLSTFARPPGVDVTRVMSVNAEGPAGFLLRAAERDHDHVSMVSADLVYLTVRVNDGT
jgi:hypothetical protein